MPSVYNGCGTWYYGQRNVQQHSGYCEACQATRALTSYDTRLYVVFVMIPIFPLGKKRIIDKCGTCSRHRAMPLADWEQAQARTEELIASYRKSPQDVELAKEILGTVASYRNVTLFMSIGPEVEQNLKDNTEVLCLLADVHGLFQFYDQRERLIRLALAVEPDDQDIREKLAGCLLTLQRPAEAEPYLSHIVEQILPDRVQYLFALAQAYQAQGNHDKALAVFSQCEQVHPMLARTPAFVQLRELSQKNVGTHVPVRAGDVFRKNRQAASLRKWAGIAAIAAVVVGVGYLAVSAFEGGHRKMYLVSGLNRPYKARLNGTVYTLPPHDVQQVQLAEGPVTVEMLDAPVTPLTVTVQTAFWSRPFKNDTFVINPDECAVVLNETIAYGAQDATPRDPARTYGVGQPLYHFTGIDYPFSEVPHSISIDSHQAVVTRQALSLLPGSGSQMAGLLMSIMAEAGREPCAHVAAMHLTLDPAEDPYGYLEVVGMGMSPGDLEAFLRPQLDRRPVQTAWHRVYQDSRPPDVEKTYATLLAKDPGNSDLMYLAGRVSSDLDRSLSLCRQAVAAPTPSAYAAHFLAYYELANGLYDDAVKHATLATRLSPASVEFRNLLIEAQIAAGQFEAALATMGSHKDSGSPRDEAYAMLESGHDKDIPALLNGLAPGDRTIVEADKMYVEVPDVYALEQSMSPVPWLRFTGHLTSGDLQHAEDDLTKTRSQGPAAFHLFLALAAVQKHEPGSADRYLDTAIKELSAGGTDDQAWAAVLAGKAPFNARLLRAVGSPVQKCATLILIGMRDPVHRAECFDLARKLNYDKRFPYQLLKKAVDATALR